MPNKKVDSLKDSTSRYAGQQWQSSLKVDNLTTREWNNASHLASQGKSEANIRKSILDSRKK